MQVMGFAFMTNNIIISFYHFQKQDQLNKNYVGLIRFTDHSQFSNINLLQLATVQNRHLRTLEHVINFVNEDNFKSKFK